MEDPLPGVVGCVRPGVVGTPRPGVAGMGISNDPDLRGDEPLGDPDPRGDAGFAWNRCCRGVATFVTGETGASAPICGAIVFEPLVLAVWGEDFEPRAAACAAAA